MLPNIARGVIAGEAWLHSVAKYSPDGKFVAGQALGVSASFEGFPPVAAGNGQLYIAGPLQSGVFIAHMSM